MGDIKNSKLLIKQDKSSKEQNFEIFVHIKRNKKESDKIAKDRFKKKKKLIKALLP